MSVEVAWGKGMGFRPAVGKVRFVSEPVKVRSGGRIFVVSNIFTFSPDSSCVIECDLLFLFCDVI